jgi:tetratricopeptide (TPR) repeat protein
METVSDTARAAAERAEDHLERGEPLLAYNETQAALAHWPDHTRLRQLQALALARSGDVERANSILDGLTRDGVHDSETLGLLGRTHKDLGLAETDPLERAAHFEAAFRIYDRAYRGAKGAGSADAAWYTGINAATAAVLRGDLAKARSIAAEVREICLGPGTHSGTVSAQYWRQATLGEASLILGDVQSAIAHYARAVDIANGRYGDLSSTRRQARLLAAHLPGIGRDVTEALSIPPVVVFTGHMIDRPDRPTPRFPPALEPLVRESLRAHLARIAPIALHASAACGADILALEAARELGIETHIVLPFPQADFRGTSVDFAGGGWGERFERALAGAASVTVTSDHYARGSKATFEYANLVLTGMGRLRAEMLDAPLAALAVMDGRDTGEHGGTASSVALWKSNALEADIIDLGELRGESASSAAPAPPAEAEGRSGARHEMRSMLFADAVGYSKLSEDQIPGYIEGFLGAVADLSRKTQHRYENVETSGDGLYMVFSNPADAGRFALELRAVTNRFDRGAWGLPSNFSLRIALHCGPVHCAIDPLTGRPLYTGPHTSRAARIEPITPPGQVYASSAFAAVAAASGSGFGMSYVGRIPLAKSYGTLGLYHLRAVSR